MIILTAFPLWLFLWFFWPILTHWLLEPFAKNVFLDILLFKLDLGQISFNPVEIALLTQQLAFLATSIVFYHIVTRACAEIKIFDEKVTEFWTFFHLFFSFSFCCSDREAFCKRGIFLFAVVIELLLGLLAVTKLLSFSLTFLSIFVHI